jgi:hypothetical protein
MTTNHLRLPLPLPLLAAILASAITTPSAAQSGHSATLTWVDTTNPAGVTYSVYRSPGLCTTSPAPVWAKITSGLTAKTYPDLSVVPANYCYAVTATLASLESVKSVPVSASIPSFSPTSVLTTLAPSGNKVTVTWVDGLNPAGATTYSVYRAVGLCSGTPTFAKLATGVGVKTYDDLTPIPGSLCYSVSAVDNGVESALAPSSAVAVPAMAPTGLQITAQ